MRTSEDGAASKINEPPMSKPDAALVERVAELELQLAAARRMLASTVEDLEESGSVAPHDETLPQLAARLAMLLAGRMKELEHKSAALEGANSELRSLTQNLDLIVRQRTRALAESESQLRRKNVELDRLIRLRGEFIAIAAHELRTPMTSLVGYLDLFTEKVLPDLGVEPRRQLTSLHRSAHRLKRLVEDMLDVSRLETGSFTLRRAPCSLNEIVLAVVDEMKPIIGGKRKLSLDLAEVAPVDGDADKLHQVTSNLVSNAVKYTREGGEIRVRVDAAPMSRGPGRARLRVWDNGKGIPASQRDRIFEPFTDLGSARHHSSSGPDSAGLGLRIARGIAELHGGSIHVDSEEGKFTEMTVLLPVVAASA
jgi:signal transduction histidine kinase